MHGHMNLKSTLFVYLDRKRHEVLRFYYEMKNQYVKHNYLYCVQLFQGATCFDPTCGSSSGLYINESLKSCACWDPFMLT